MANHPSAEKRHRQNLKRAKRNRSLRSRLRNAMKAARTAISSGSEDRTTKVQEAVRTIQRSASKRVIHKNTASRYVSRIVQADKNAQS